MGPCDDEGNPPTMQSIPKDILEDLCSRFLINIPEEERNDLVRMCFQVELAHWFYLDFYRQENPALPGWGFQKFMESIFAEFPFLNKSNSDLQEIYAGWKKYKFEVPVFGAILLDESLENCLLVRGFHKRISWGFPKGKVNKDENGDKCAIREVKEETGMDITEYIDPNEYLERSFHDHQVRLYIVPAVPLNSDFEPKTRGEIAEIKWFGIDCLPLHKKDTTPREKLSLNANSFFMVQPFVKELRKWVSQKKQNIEQLLLFSNAPPIPKYDPISERNSKSINDKMTKEQEERFRRRKEEEQRRFQEIHSLIHPLRESHIENERRLKDLLGINEPPPVQSKSVQKHSDSSKSDRVKAQDQPAAIRKLLTGTVNVSPSNTPERKFGQGFGSPGATMKEGQNLSGAVSPNSQIQRAKRSKKGKKAQESTPAENITRNLADTQMQRVDISRNKLPSDVRELGAPKTSLIAFSQPESSYQERSSPKNQNASSKLDNRTTDFRQSQLPSEDSNTTAFTKPSEFGYSRSAFRSYKERPKDTEERNWFSFKAPGFTNFRFDRASLVATLPPATNL